MVTGDPVHYVAGGGTITPRLATNTIYRTPIPEQKPKPTGLDWDAHTPTCSSCSTKSGQIDGTGLCPTCRGAAITPERTDVESNDYASYQVLDQDDVDRRFNAPTETPQAAEPAPTPRPVVEPKATHAAPTSVAPRPAAPTVRAKVSRVGTHHVIVALRSMTDPIDQVRVAALLNDLLGALTQTPAAAPQSPAAAGPKSEGRRPVGKRARPSDAHQFETFPGPRPRKKRIDNFPLDQARALYLEERMTVPAIAERLDCGRDTVRRHLKDAGVPMRDDRAASNGGANKFSPTPELTEQITTRYVDQQLSCAHISDQLSVDRRVIRRVLADQGITIRPPVHLASTPITDAVRDDVVARYSEGTSIADLAAKHHLRNIRVREVLVDAGVTIRVKGASTRNSDRIHALGTTAHDVKAWAVAAGLADRITPGLVPAALIDAYAEAHPREDIAS